MRISSHEISRRLKISCRSIRQTFSKFHIVATKPGAGRLPKIADREKKLIKFQQLLGDTVSYDMLIQI